MSHILYEVAINAYFTISMKDLSRHCPGNHSIFLKTLSFLCLLSGFNTKNFSLCFRAVQQTIWSQYGTASLCLVLTECQQETSLHA